MSYTDIKLLNCNRSASVQALGDNDSNPAIFTNTLQQTMKLNIGDQVSLERAFVNEVGAGNPSTIEFKGTTRRVKEDGAIKSTHTSKTYTNVVFGDYNREKTNTYTPSYRLGGYLSIRASEVKTDIPLKDNHAPMIIGYYITANEYPNYIQQPRRWLQIADAGNPVPFNSQLIFSEADTQSSGACKHLVNPWCFARRDWIRRSGGYYQQRVDNKRYTMFIKNTATYESGVAGNADQYPQSRTDGVFSETTYYRLREKIDIEVKKGFNTQTAVAEQITEQLQKTEPPEIFEIYDGDSYVRPITQTIQSTTYKAINCQNFFYCKQANYLAYIGGSQGQAATNWIASMAYIAVKRPEIYEEGRDMSAKIRPEEVLNRTTGAVELPKLNNAWEGFQTLITLDNSADPTKNFKGDTVPLNVEYNEANLELLRKFFDTQALYPELWDDVENMDAYIRNADELLPYTESRFIHFNPYHTTGAAPTNHSFGSDGFLIEAGAQDVAKSTIPVFFKWKEEQRDLYIAPEDWVDSVDKPIHFSYGFAQPYKWEGAGLPETKYYISIRTDLAAGIPFLLFNNLATTLTAGRLCGYDFHATAYSTAIITPHSGYSYVDIGTRVLLDNGGAISYESYSDNSTFMKNTINHTTTDISPYMTQTYVGANTPALNFNPETNRFNFDKFHTSNNVGNDRLAGSTKSPSINNESLYSPPGVDTDLKLAPTPINADGGDTVYKINPRPPNWGYSPTFKPYIVYNQSYRVGTTPHTPEYLHSFPATGANKTYFEANNSTIEPYSIFDAHGGIYVEDWGANEAEWKGCLWDIIGFDYDQLNATASSDNVLTSRVNNRNLKGLYRMTTNAEVVATDTKSMIANDYGATLYSTSLPYPHSILTWDVAPLGATYHFVLAPNQGTPLTHNPEIVIKTTSVEVEANQLPKSVLKPYYTVRSSILEGSTSIGGNPTGANLPLMGIVDKYSAQNDYFLGNPSDLVFTITKPMTISDITTSIHDPDGTFANVDGTSAVIYKIVKSIQAENNIVNEILAEENDKKKK